MSSYWCVAIVITDTQNAVHNHTQEFLRVCRIIQYLVNTQTYSAILMKLKDMVSKLQLELHLQKQRKLQNKFHSSVLCNCNFDNRIASTTPRPNNSTNIRPTPTNNQDTTHRTNCHRPKGPFQRHVCDQKKWKISLLNGFSSWYKHAINNFLIDNSASCSSQDTQVFEN